MRAVGRDGMLDLDQVLLVSAYVFSFSNPDYSTPETVDRIEAGREVFVANCASCHGEDARGMQEVGAPNLTDAHWIYGGEMASIVTTVHGGRQEHMQTWGESRAAAELKIIAQYVPSPGVARLSCAAVGARQGRLAAPSE